MSCECLPGDLFMKFVHSFTQPITERSSCGFLCFSDALNLERGS